MQSVIKRSFDIIFSIILFFLFFWVLVLAWIISVIDTRTNGVFIQERIGQYGRKFHIYKLRTMKAGENLEVLHKSKLGKLLRKYKLDELPQLINVLKGEMSIVGPRPDISGYYDLLKGEDRKILELKPGLTSLASLKYYNEDALLENQYDPLVYNDEVLFPDKIKMNLEYYHHQSFYNDLQIIAATCFLFLKINKN